MTALRSRAFDAFVDTNFPSDADIQMESGVAELGLDSLRLFGMIVDFEAAMELSLTERDIELVLTADSLGGLLAEFRRIAAQ